MTAAAALAAIVVIGVILLAARGARWMTPPRSAPLDGLARRNKRPRGWRIWRSRTHRDDDTDVAHWCEQVSAELRSGVSITSAIADTDARWAPPILSPVTHAVQRGRTLGAALEELPADPATARGLLVPVLSASARLGGPTASAVDRVAVTLHARSAERAERRAASAQARLSALVLTVMPFAVLAFLAATEPSVRAALHSPLGLSCLVAGGALNVAGWWWMRRLIGRVA